jgi:predicted aldo/keto reductase-like oxidoreductase
MNHENAKNVNRRDFIRLGSTGAAGVALTGLGGLNASAQAAAPAAAPAAGAPAAGATADQAAAQITGKLPTRTLGKTGLQVGCIIGASDWSKDVIPLAVQAGVNYWHKANYWSKNSKAGPLPDAIKSQPRESYFLEVCLDRLSGYLAGPVGDADHFYNAVKASVAGTDCGYFDMMRFHYGHHSIDEVKTQTGFVDAFTRLQKEGLVKHLSISQHNYPPSKITPDGQTAYEILPYIMDNTPYEAAQFFYSYSGDSGRGASPRDQVEALLATCKQKNFGSIAMKTMAGVGRFLANKQDPTNPKNRIGGKEKDLFTALVADPKYAGSTPGSAIVKWLMSNPNLSAATICISNFDQLQENFKAAMSPAMTENDHNMLNLLAAFNKGTTCLLCADCATSCPEEIAIIDILRYERYAMDYHDLPRAKAEYKTLTKNGTSCIACGDCMPTCSADINIISKLKEVHNLLSS